MDFVRYFFFPREASHAGPGEDLRNPGWVAHCTIKIVWFLSDTFCPREASHAGSGEDIRNPGCVAHCSENVATMQK